MMMIRLASMMKVRFLTSDTVLIGNFRAIKDVALNTEG